MLLLPWILTNIIVVVRGAITIKDNGYEGIVVAIDEKVPENAELLEELKESFRRASELLYTATRQHLYFGVISIQLPSSWETLSQNVTEFRSYETGDFIVDNPPSQHGNRPFTMQPFGCGIPGDFTVLPPGFFNGTSVQNYGPLYKVIVHEWGHLRFGLFDEYPVTPDQRFYTSIDNEIEATRCTAALTGSTTDQNGNQCTDALSENSACEYTDHETQEGSFASLMYKTNLQHVDKFCDNDTEDADTFHNPEAPTDQNRLCNAKSAWEVFLEHQDFNRSQATYSTPPEVRFITYKIRRPRTVIVMDTSGSMLNRINAMAEAVRLYLRRFLREGEEVGLVMFSTMATKLHNLVIVSPSTIEELVASVPTRATGGTCIGCGIEAALEMLNPGGERPAPDSNKGGTVVVLSDGEENSGPPYLYEVQDRVVDEQEVTLHSIALTNAADSNVDSLAISAGGLTFIHSYTEDSNALKEAFQTINENDANPYDRNIQLKSDVKNIAASGTLTDKIIVDETIGKGTRFIFDFEGSSITVRLTSPDGDIYTEADASLPGASNIYIFTIDDSIQQIGTWEYTVKNNDASSTRVAITVTSRASNPERPPIIAEPFWSHRDGTARIATSKPDAPVLFVRVSQGYSPVVGANVKAFITVPSGAASSVELELIDKGGTPFDTYAGDGIYANYFQARNGIGRYEVRIEVEASNVTTIDNRRIIGRGAPTDEPDTDPGTVGTGNFKRVANAGSYNVITIPDKYNPDRITSLAVISVDISRQVLVLSWAATGSELNVGTASYYDLRYSTSSTSLKDDFDNQPQITQDQLVLGDLNQPNEAGQEELYILNIPDEDAPYLYFAVVALDTNGRTAKSAVSNIVKASLVAPALPAIQLATPPPTTKPETTVEETSTQVQTTEAMSTPFATTLLTTEEEHETTEAATTTVTETTEATTAEATTAEETTVINTVAETGTSIQPQSTESDIVTETTDTVTVPVVNALPELLTDSKLGLIIGIPLAAVCVTLMVITVCAVMYGSRKRRPVKTRYPSYGNKRRGFDNHGYDYPATRWNHSYAYP